MYLKRKTKIFLCILLSVILFFVVINICPPKKVMQDNPFIIEEGERPLIAAHRGGKNLQPENTLKAIDYSYENFKIDIIELDLYLTKDNYLILNHNSTINACTELKGQDKYYIRDHTLSEIQKFNFGYNFEDKNGNFPYRDLLNGVEEEKKSEILKENKLRVLTIEELFEAYKDSGIYYIIEIKDSNERGFKAADILVDLIKNYNLEEKVVIGTYNTEVEKYLNKEYKDIMRGASMGSAAKFIVTTMLGVNLFDNSTFCALQIPTDYDIKITDNFEFTLRLDKKSYIKRAHRRGISVQFWTINDKEEMRELIELGADVIMTDNPDVLYELLIEMGY